MLVRKLVVNSDSQLVMSQVNGNFTVEDKSMVAYLIKVMGLLHSFERFELTQIPRAKNIHAMLY